MIRKEFVIIAGGVAVLYGVYCFFRLKAVQNWPAVEGKILQSAKSTKLVNFQRQEDADIVYQYTVGSKTYTSTVIKAGGDMSSTPSKTSQSEADQLLTKYPEGSPVMVYYNPKFPQMACLEKGGAEAMVISIGFGTLAMLAGYLFLK